MLDAKKGKRVILIAELDAQVIGQIFVNFHSTWRKSFHGQISGYLHSFRVKPGFRNQSVGRTLIAKAEGILKEHRYRGAVISVARTNEAALRLYQHLGYEVFREDPGQWSFIDHNNKVQHVSEPAFILYRNL
ncbi:MAG: GNAT family N-acetyltransferase [Anaerolineales bacterium]|nr:MAG: GNAT family N-acetyltransferase [Anaerolineales bacterium]